MVLKIIQDISNESASLPPTRLLLPFMRSHVARTREPPASACERQQQSRSMDRDNWRQMSKEGIKRCEQTLKERWEAARERRNNNENQLQAQHFCERCGRGFASRAGLLSHLRAHERQQQTRGRRRHRFDGQP